MTTTAYVLMLDPMPDSELDFVRSLLPASGFEVSAPEPDAAAPAEPAGDADVDRHPHRTGHAPRRWPPAQPEARPEVRRPA